MKTYAPVMTLVLLNLAVLLTARTISRSALSPAAESGKRSIELIHEVVNLRAPLRRNQVGPRLNLKRTGDAAVEPVAWTELRNGGQGLVLRGERGEAPANDRP
jgi:hypothetical protein